MKKARKLARPKPDRPPRRIQVLSELKECETKGYRKPWLQEECERLCADDGEILLAMRWGAGRRLFPSLVELEFCRMEAIDNALKRKDLTIAEGLKLREVLAEGFRKEEELLHHEDVHAPSSRDQV